ncbi:MAG TPA: discoidin domain-containing protein, partial [Ignavibacteriaceae bacterium]
KTIDGQGMESPDSRWQRSSTKPDTLIFDFGNESSLDSLRISFYEWQSNRIYKYSVNCSVDSIKWHPIIKNVWSEENEWIEIEFDSTSARYVELILQESNENTMASIWEIEFYGPDRFYKMNNGTELPTSFMISQNYPNPFNPSTTFSYSIAKQSKVLIRIYDIIGNEIETLVSEEKPVGTYELTWDASNLPSGVYLYQLTAGDFIQTKKMILMK